MSRSTRDASDPAVAIGPDATRYLAWVDRRNGSEQIYVASYGDIDGWQSLGGSHFGGGVSNSFGASIQPTTAIDSAGNLLVAWTQWSDTGSNIQLATWNVTDQSWSTEAMTTSNTAHSPKLAVGSSIGPVLAWIDASSGVENGYALRFNGTSWSEIDGSASTTGITNSGSPVRNLELAADGDAVAVSWTETVGAVTQIYVKQFSVASDRWLGIADSATGVGVSASSAGAVESSIAYLAGEPVVAWLDGDVDEDLVGAQIRVRRFDGNGLIDATPEAIGTDGVAHTAPQLASGSGTVHLAWSRIAEIGSNTAENAVPIFVTTWDGDGFNSMFPTDISDRGVHRGQSDASNLSLAVDANGLPQIAWQESPENDASQVYLRGQTSAGQVTGSMYVADGTPGNTITEILASNDLGPGDWILIEGIQTADVTIGGNDGGVG